MRFNETQYARRIFRVRLSVALVLMVALSWTKPAFATKLGECVLRLLGLFSKSLPTSSSRAGTLLLPQKVGPTYPKEKIAKLQDLFTRIEASEFRHRFLYFNSGDRREDLRSLVDYLHHAASGGTIDLDTLEKTLTYLQSAESFHVEIPMELELKEKLFRHALDAYRGKAALGNKTKELYKIGHPPSWNHRFWEIALETAKNGEPELAARLFNEKGIGAKQSQHRDYSEFRGYLKGLIEKGDLQKEQEPQMVWLFLRNVLQNLESYAEMIRSTIEAGDPSGKGATAIDNAIQASHRDVRACLNHLIEIRDPFTKTEEFAAIQRAAKELQRQTRLTPQADFKKDIESFTHRFPN